MCTLIPEDFEIRKRRSKDGDGDAVDLEPEHPPAEHDHAILEHELHDVEHDREDPDDLFGLLPVHTTVTNHNINVFVHDRGGAVPDEAADDETGLMKKGIFANISRAFSVFDLAFDGFPPTL